MRYGLLLLKVTAETQPRKEAGRVGSRETSDEPPATPSQWNRMNSIQLSLGDNMRPGEARQVGILGPQGYRASVTDVWDAGVADLRCSGFTRQRAD